MSDYIFMLESIVGADQRRVLEQVRAAAEAVGVNLFLTGGAMRDMLGGSPIRDLDFSVEGNALKVVKALEEKGGVQTLSVDENRRSVELLFDNGVTAQVAMSRKERYPKAGGKPQVTPSTMQEDLRGRDFTINAMALSLSKASRGLLMDPTNGLADLGHRELRTTHPYVFYDDPVRMLRLLRLRIRLGFEVEERTRSQYENARAAQMESQIPARALLEELRRTASEPSPSEVVKALDEAGLLTLVSPALTGPRLNLPAVVKLEKAERLVESANLVVEPKLAQFLYALASKLTPKEKAALIKATDMPKAEVERWNNLAAHTKKLDNALKSANLRKPSQVYEILRSAAPGDMVFLLCYSAQRVVQERIRHYFEKYLPAMQEVPQAEWDALEGQPGSPKYERARLALVAAHLDVRKKPPEPPPVEAPPAPPEPVAVRGRVR